MILFHLNKYKDIIIEEHEFKKLSTKANIYICIIEIQLYLCV